MNIDRIETTMSSQDLRPTEETTGSVEIVPLTDSDEPTLSHLLAVANFMTSIVYTGVMLALA